MKEGCKVSGPYSETKWVNGANTGVADPLTKKPIYLVFLHVCISSDYFA